jgi:hypothetical protein
MASSDPCWRPELFQSAHRPQPSLQPSMIAFGRIVAVLPRAPRTDDVVALIGFLASLEGELMASEDDDVPDWARRFADRLSRDGLLTADADGRQVRQSLHDLNQRLRYVFGEFDEPPRSMPVP